MEFPSMTLPRLFLFAFFLCASQLVKAEKNNEIPMEYRQGLLWVKVQLERSERPLTFLLDSGAQNSLLSESTTIRLGLPLGEREIVQGVSAEIPSHWVENVGVQVGPLRYRTSFLTLDLRALSHVTNREIDGVLGMDFFRGRVVQLDFAAGKIRLLNRCGRTPESVALPIKHLNDAILVPVGLGNAQPRWARLDTGSNQDLQWDFGSAQAASPRRGAAVGLAPSSLRYTHGAVRLGGAVIESHNIGIQPGPVFPGEAGLLGNGILSQFTVTVDYKSSVVVLDPRR